MELGHHARMLFQHDKADLLFCQKAFANGESFKREVALFLQLKQATHLFHVEKAHLDSELFELRARSECILDAIDALFSRKLTISELLNNL